jgi:hypothetical protein
MTADLRHVLEPVLHVVPDRGAHVGAHKLEVESVPLLGDRPLAAALCGVAHARCIRHVDCAASPAKHPRSIPSAVESKERERRKKVWIEEKRGGTKGMDQLAYSVRQLPLLKPGEHLNLA